ncbi:4-hydroxythreonine-4-phosphate dehydrogenase [Cephaloticoccus primus]|uniref:4-hydroxythreonine-4-phosphate dehydrogenase n=1 Tax=Cephaloticoccus primus TaxID=1548207 RepID=A0A139STV4_9BACT|nr:4-hydroxythreonine-4-phosphate dehydrogenase [Cephaloticoccus primus]
MSGAAPAPRSSARVALTCGDPAGLGPELIAAVLHGENSRALGDLVVIGPESWLRELPAGVEKIAVGAADFVATAGAPDEAGARVALAAMERAAAGCVEGRWAGVVTGPVSKAQLAKVGYTFPGQTEFFAARWGGEPVMGFVGERLRVVLATWHVPLSEVPNKLSPQSLERAVAAAASLAVGARGKLQTPPSGAGSLARVGLAPMAEGPASHVAGATHTLARIAVCGLNPHAGEGGLLGAEERDLLNPTLARLGARFPGLVPECLPGDTVFARALRGEFDAVVALYHDQGLAPLKAVDFDTAVNVTLGLPFVRTSPDHGTAFGLAGKGREGRTGGASPRSTANALALARDLIRERNRT